MKTVKNTKPKVLEFDYLEAIRIENKMLKTTEQLTQSEIEFLKGHAECGSPMGEFDLGLYYILFKRDEKTAEEWWNKFFYHSNGLALWKASGIFAFLGDEYYEWSMKCLRRSAWRQFPIAKRMLKAMGKNPYKFPEA